MVKTFLKLIFFIGLPIAIGLLVGLPYLLGIGIQDELCAFQDDLQTEFPQLTIVEREYERGWFTSRVRTLWLCDTGYGEPLCVKQCDRIAHGPFVWRAGRVEAVVAIIDSTSELSFGLAKATVLPQMASATRIDWKREISSTVELPYFEYVCEEEGVRIACGPMKGEMVVHAKAGRCHVVGSLSHFLLEGDWGVVAVDGAGVSGDMDLTMAVAGYPCGFYNYWADEVRMLMPEEDGDQLAIVCYSPSAFASYVLEDGKLESDFRYRWNGLDFDGSGVGRMHWSGRIRGLNPVGHEELIALLSSSAEEAQSEEWWAHEFTRLLPTLIAKRPQIEISEFELMTPDGAITGTLTAAIDPYRVGESPASLLHGLSVETKWEVPVALLDLGVESPTWALPVTLLAPFMVESGENGVIDFAFKNGFIRLHEERYPADLFFAGLVEFVQELVAEEE